MDWIGVDYCDVFLDSHSDGTHSLQRIHWWSSDVMLNFSKSVLIKTQTHLGLGCPEDKKSKSKLWQFLKHWLVDFGGEKAEKRRGKPEHSLFKWGILMNLMTDVRRTHQTRPAELRKQNVPPKEWLRMTSRQSQHCFCICLAGLESIRQFHLCNQSSGRQNPEQMPSYPREDAGNRSPFVPVGTVVF